jgi:hypothetical protein
VAIDDPVDDGVVRYLAAAPPDFRASFSGSALPFASQKQALENTPNSGRMRVGARNSVDVPLVFPNSYYVASGTVLVPPTLYVEYVSGGEVRHSSVEISEGVPYRKLTWPAKAGAARDSPAFYDRDLPVRTQEQILRASGFPAKNAEARDFWGGRPAV